jgi:hypothetical protein
VLTGAASVTLFKVEVPDFKRVGEMAALLCNYSLGERERLYSVKWYKDDEEFYRYVPKSHPVSQSYKVDGVKVEVGLLLLSSFSSLAGRRAQAERRFCASLSRQLVFSTRAEQ